MPITPRLSSEEYVEQAYLFRVARERWSDGQPFQDILAAVQHELLSTTKLPWAVDVLLAELRHSGMMHDAVARLSHYFTPLQALILQRAEEDNNRFTIASALTILQREAEYRARGASEAGMFVFEVEAISRNRLGYADGLDAMRQDGFYSDAWRDYMGLVQSQIGVRELAELIFGRSQHYVDRRRASDPSYTPSFPVLFGEKEGRIAAANMGKEPMYLFATLQRQLDYPEVPRLPRQDERALEITVIRQVIESLKVRLSVLEAEVLGKVDPKQFVAPPQASPTNPPTFPPDLDLL